MTEREAGELLMRHLEEESEAVTIERSYAQWTGRVVAVVGKPCLILEESDGTRRAIVLDGAEEVALPRKDHDV